MVGLVAVIVFYLVFVPLAVLSQMTSQAKARRREDGIDPKGDFSLGEPLSTLTVATLGLAMSAITVTMALSALAAEPAFQRYSALFFGLPVLLAGASVYLLVKWLTWRIEVADGTLTHRRPFRGTVELPLASISQMIIIPGATYDMMCLYDNLGQCTLKLRSSVVGYGLIRQRFEPLMPAIVTDGREVGQARVDYSNAGQPGAFGSPDQLGRSFTVRHSRVELALYLLLAVFFCLLLGWTFISELKAPYPRPGLLLMSVPTYAVMIVISAMNALNCLIWRLGFNDGVLTHRHLWRGTVVVPLSEVDEVRMGVHLVQNRMPLRLYRQGRLIVKVEPALKGYELLYKRLLEYPKLRRALTRRQIL